MRGILLAGLVAMAGCFDFDFNSCHGGPRPCVPAGQSLPLFGCGETCCAGAVQGFFGACEAPPPPPACQAEFVGVACSAAPPCTNCVCTAEFIRCPSVRFTCNGYVYCRNTCDGLPGCLSACAASLTSHGSAAFDAALQCSQDACVRGGKCALDPAMKPVDPSGAAPGSCRACLEDSASDLYRKKCAGPDCHPSACAPLYLACHEDSLPADLGVPDLGALRDLTATPSTDGPAGD